MSKPSAERLTLPRLFLRSCRRARRRSKVADSTGVDLTGGALLTRTLVLRRIFKRLLARDEAYVGVLLPPSVGAVLANAALPLLRRIAVNLNYTMPPEVINDCIRQCGIRRVITSRRVMDRLKLDLHAELVYLEDLPRRATRTDKLVSALQAQGMPIRWLERWLRLTKVGRDEVLTVIFTSGSTGQPKGVMLTHTNVGSNIDAIDKVIHLTQDDVAIGVLPFFHSYGYTATMWTVLALAPKGVYHHNPLDAKEVGKLSHDHHVTVFMATPTFLRTYLRRCESADFMSLDVVFGAAEKLSTDLAAAFETKFGVRPFEAYGATELSPLVAVNLPESRAANTQQPTSREGSVGRPIPSVLVKVVDPESFAALPVGTAGMLLVSGPGVMAGYLHQPELTAKVMHEGWYITGDMAFIDADGFIHITGRQSRFSKIGGEMVPHIKLEETIGRILNLGEDELRAVVTAVPDAKKGERLVVVHTALDQSPQEICRELAQQGLPNLWIPSPDSFYEVEHIPVLGTGKLDLSSLKQLALAKFSSAVATR